jgi:subtilisin-like proprotein convertase family protein
MKILSFINSLLLMCVFFTVAISAQTTFTNSTSITINDNAPATPYPSTISVAGLSGTIAASPGSVKVQLKNFSHPYPGEVAMVLVGPTGKAFLIQDSAGDKPMNNVTYTLSDDGATPLPFTGAWTAGTYKPTAFFNDTVFPAPGPGTNYDAPAPAGSATFSSVFVGTNPNGDWKLYIVDLDAQDAGSISGGWSLTITTAGSTGGGTIARANVDFNGDGKTDWAVTRGTTSPFTEKSSQNSLNNDSVAKSYRERLKMRKQNINSAAVPTQMYWYTNINGTGSTNVIQFGTSESDFVIPKDFDGDGKDDIAIWRPATANFASAFYILQSSNNTVRIDQFGMTGDDPTVTGDYDGDKKADPATFRCPETGGQCYFFYRGSLNNPSRRITYVPFGFGNPNDYYANPGDFDGDGKDDFCLQRDGGDGAGQFVLLKSLNMSVEYIIWGRVTDTIVPGDFDGDGKSDFMVTRNIGGSLSWSLLTRTGGGTGASPIFWGIPDDFQVPGDYDGDGRTDIAIWRPNPDPNQNYYYVRRSGNTTLQSFEWGLSGDIPVQNWNVH